MNPVDGQLERADATGPGIAHDKADAGSSIGYCKGDIHDDRLACRRRGLGRGLQGLKLRGLD